MGNLSFVSFNRSVSDTQFTEMLRSVIDEHYSSCYQVKTGVNSNSESWWTIELKDGILGPKEGSPDYWGICFFRATNYRSSVRKLYKGKFEHKHMGPLWGYWFTDQIHGHLSKKFGVISSDEGCAGYWKIDPEECLTPMSWAEKRHPRTWEKNSEVYRKQMVDEIPIALRSLQG